MLDDFKDLLLIFNVIYVLALNDFGLFHGLDGKFLAFVFLEPAYLYVSERT
jgi:hypothetical protein